VSQRSSSFDGIRIALRTLGKQPGFTAVVILSLALAIALNTTMYSVLDALVSPRVDIRRPEDVWVIRMYGDVRSRSSLAARESALRSGLRNVEAVAWVDGINQYRTQIFEAGTRFMEGSVRAVGIEYFDLIGPRVIAGRTFRPEDLNAAPRPVVLSEQTASSLFAEGTDPIGATVSITDTAFVVIGVLSRHSEFPNSRAGAWTLGAPGEKQVFTRVIRLRPGASAQDADRDLQVVAARISAAAGETTPTVAFRFFKPYQPQFSRQRFHLAIGLSVIAVLLVACANIANMQLARGITRRRELALRTALGATRGRIVRHLLIEIALLAAGGLVLGLVFTAWAASMLKASIPPSIGSYIVEPQLSWRVLVFALVATAACVFIVGLVPAIRVSNVDPNEMLKAGNGTGATRSHRRQYGYLVAAEIALALGLLSGASVVVRSAMKMSTDTMRFDPLPLVGGFLRLDAPAKPERRPQSELLQEAARRVAAVPGVIAAGARTSSGAIGGGVTISDSARGVRVIPAPMYSYSIVSPGYLRAMGMPILRGRNFAEGERDEAAVIIDEFTAASLWPNANPVGAMIKFGDAKSKVPFVRIVGVAGYMNTRRNGPWTTNEMRLGAVFYLPGPGDTVNVTGNNTAISIVARGSGDVSRLPLELRRVGVIQPRSMGEGFRQEREGRQFIARMFSLFALMGIGLAAFGIYGVVAHSVAERRRELGVRIALGANARDILRAVLRESVLIALIGVALGLLGTKYGVRLLGAFALEDDMYNAPLFAAAALALLATAAASAFAPALRATKVDPTESLRSE
jgi:putative ABC transport system permease protein